MAKRYRQLDAGAHRVRGVISSRFPECVGPFVDVEGSQNPANTHFGDNRGAVASVPLRIIPIVGEPGIRRRGLEELTKRTFLGGVGRSSGHPDLANAVNTDFSRDFTGDGFGAGEPYGATTVPTSAGSLAQTTRTVLASPRLRPQPASSNVGSSRSQNSYPSRTSSRPWLTAPRAKPTSRTSVSTARREIDPLLLPIRAARASTVRSAHRPDDVLRTDELRRLRVLQNFMNAKRIHRQDGRFAEVVWGRFSRATDVEVGGWDGSSAPMAIEVGAKSALTIDTDFD